MSERLPVYRAEVIKEPQIVAYEPEDSFLNGKIDEYLADRVIVKTTMIEQQEGDNSVEQRPVENIILDKTIYKHFHTIRRLFGIYIKKPFYNTRLEMASKGANDIANYLNKKHQVENPGSSE